MKNTENNMDNNILHWTPDQEQLLKSGDLLEAFKTDIRNGLGMDIEINNHSSVDLNKVLNTVFYYAQNNLARYTKRHSKFLLEVWIDEEGHDATKLIQCGMSLKRPKQKDFFIKKEAEQINHAVKMVVDAMEEILRKEDKHHQEHIDKVDRHEMWRKEIDSARQ